MQNTSQDIPTAFSACKIPCCRLHFKDDCINDCKDDPKKLPLPNGSVVHPLKLEYNPTKCEIYSLLPLMSRLSLSSFMFHIHFLFDEKSLYS